MLVVVAAALLAVCLHAQQVQYLPLNGDWVVSNGSSSFQASVPGQVHIDLLNAGVIGLFVVCALRAPVQLRSRVLNL
jgi:hypothetical protein